MRSASLLLVVGLVVGCGGPAPTGIGESSVSGPHGGVVVRLPNDQGYAEVVIEPAVEGRRAQESAQVAVYFLKPDARTALASLPTEVSVRLELPNEGPKSLALKAESRGQDPAEAGRFASQVGPYLVDRVMGELTANVGGKSVTLPFASPR